MAEATILCHESPHQCRFASNFTKRTTATPKGGRAALLRRKAPYCSFCSLFSLFSLFQLIKSPRVVVELETGCLWLSFL